MTREDVKQLKEVFANATEKMAKVSSGGRLTNKEAGDFIETCTTISSLGNLDTSVTVNKIHYPISAYEVADKLKGFLTPRGVFYDSGDMSPDLRTETAERKSDLEASFRAHDEAVDDNEKYWQVYSSEYEKLINDAREVPCTPAEFKQVQVKLMNSFKIKDITWLNADDVTQPVLLSDVNLIKAGDMTFEPNGSWDSLPIDITIAHDLYLGYKYSYPYAEYIKLFVTNVMSGLALG